MRSCRAALHNAYSVGLTLAVDAALAQRVSLAAEGPLAARGEALQISLGEGPCIQALTQRKAVLVPDLDDAGLTGAWPVYAQRARTQGIRAAFALCAVVRNSRTSRTSPQPGLVLSLYRDQSGTMSDADLQTVRLHVEAADLLLLTVPVPGEDDAGDAWLLPADAVVHQATGVISYRHNVSTSQALALLRAHAHTRQTELYDLARAIIRDGLHLQPLPPPDPTSP